MTEFKALTNKRRSIRMKGYDYALEGSYFVTITTYQRKCLFGDVINGMVHLNTYGKIAHEQWTRLHKRFFPSEFDTFVIMPNHVRGIIHIVRGAGEGSKEVHGQSPPQRPYVYPHVAAGSLGAIVRAYKASVSFQVNAIRGFTHPPIWQRNYYEHIIRDDKEYAEIWKYIQENPGRWTDDKFFIFPTS